MSTKRLSVIHMLRVIRRRRQPEPMTDFEPVAKRYEKSHGPRGPVNGFKGMLQCGYCRNQWHEDDLPPLCRVPFSNCYAIPKTRS